MMMWRIPSKSSIIKKPLFAKKKEFSSFQRQKAKSQIVAMNEERHSKTTLEWAFVTR